MKHIRTLFKRHKKNMTNGDRFRSMTDEELSGWINCCGVCSKAEESCDGECRKGIIEFLGQEYKGDF